MALHALKISDWQRYSDRITENDEYEMVVAVEQDKDGKVYPIVERVYRDVYSSAIEDLESDRPLYSVNVNVGGFPMLMCKYNGDMINYNADFQACMDAVEDVLMDIDMETKVDATNYIATTKDISFTHPSIQCIVSIVRSKLGGKDNLKYAAAFIVEVLKSHIACIEPFGINEDDKEAELIEEMSTLEFRTLLCCLGYCKEFQVLQAKRRMTSVTEEYETFVYLVETYGYNSVCRQLYREVAERRYFKKR